MNRTDDVQQIAKWWWSVKTCYGEDVVVMSLWRMEGRKLLLDVTVVLL